MQLTKNFHLNEFIESKFYNTKQQVDVWHQFHEDKSQLQRNLDKLSQSLQALRDELGVAVNIKIAYRPLWWELKQGRSGKSQHCKCKAADIVVKGLTPKELNNTIERLISDGKMSEGGLGLYGNFIHYDVRGTRARWDNIRNL